MPNDAKTIFRSKHRRNYTVVSNEILYNPGLSGKAKWVLMYLLSKPEDWQTRISDIVAHGTDGRDAVLSGIKELKAAGYLQKVRVTCPETKRVLRWETHVFDEPQPELQNTGKPHVEKPDSGKPQSGKADTTKYGSNQRTELTHSLTTTKEAGSSKRERKDASLLDRGALDRESLAVAEWMMTTYPMLEQYGITLTKRLVDSCFDRGEIDTSVAVLALSQAEESGRLRDAQRFIEDAIAKAWLPSKYWLENGAPVAGWKIPPNILEYIESKRPVEDLAALEVSA